MFSLSCCLFFHLFSIFLSFPGLGIQLAECIPTGGIIDRLQLGDVTIGECSDLCLHGWQQVLRLQLATLLGRLEEVREVESEIFLDAREPHEDSEELKRLKMGGLIGGAVCGYENEVRHLLKESVFLLEHEQLVVLLDVEIIEEADVT